MFKNKKVISIIPARKNSKSLKNKNIHKINKHSLLEIAILSSKNSSVIDETIVTSDSDKILKIAKKFKCKIIKRPNLLSQDTTTANQVINHVLKKINESGDFIIIYLQPTSPFRNHKHVNRAFNILKKYKTTNLVSVKLVSEIFYKSYNFNKYLKPNFKKFVNANRQKLKKIYCANGAIYIFSFYNFLKKKKIPNHDLVPYLMNDLDSIDINNDYDLELSRCLKKKIYYK